MNVVERLYVTPSRFNSYKQTAANQVLMELTMLFTFSCIFHNLSTYSIGQLFARSTFIKWDTCARNEIYDTRSVCKKCESERARCVWAQSIRFGVRCRFERSSLFQQVTYTRCMIFCCRSFVIILFYLVLLLLFWFAIAFCLKPIINIIRLFVQIDFAMSPHWARCVSARLLART